MKLNEYFDKYSVNKRCFADKARLSRPIIDKILKGGNITLQTAKKIEMASFGEVSVNDLLPGD